MSQWFLICAWCKAWARKHDEAVWKPIESAEFQAMVPEFTSHGICPICNEAFFQNEEFDQFVEALNRSTENK